MFIKKLITANLCLGLLVGCGAQQKDVRSSAVSQKSNNTFSEADLEGFFYGSEGSEQLDLNTKDALKTAIYNQMSLTGQYEDADKEAVADLVIELQQATADGDLLEATRIANEIVELSKAIKGNTYSLAGGGIGNLLSSLVGVFTGGGLGDIIGGILKLENLFGGSSPSPTPIPEPTPEPTPEPNPEPTPNPNPNPNPIPPVSDFAARGPYSTTSSVLQVVSHYSVLLT